MSKKTAVSETPLTDAKAQSVLVLGSGGQGVPRDVVDVEDARAVERRLNTLSDASRALEEYLTEMAAAGFDVPDAVWVPFTNAVKEQAA